MFWLYTLAKKRLVMLNKDQTYKNNDLTYNGLQGFISYNVI